MIDNYYCIFSFPEQTKADTTRVLKDTTSRINLGLIKSFCYNINYSSYKFKFLKILFDDKESFNKLTVVKIYWEYCRIKYN